jgi:hypothetical protein
MLLSAVQEDKSMQNGLFIFKRIFEDRCNEVIQIEQERLREEKINDSLLPVKSGRPKKYLSRLPKTFRQPLSESTAAYSNARKKTDIICSED